MAYELLSEPIRRYIRDRRWDTLRPIQAAAIKSILADDRNYILSSRTASGKTEAALLPILSKVDFTKKGVAVLYIAPLIALINDQFQRVDELCAYLDVPVTKWHGEASKALKNALLKEPRGIVLITPESLEAMFVNAPYNINALFSNLQYLVIDEVHTFIGADRGVQLRSLLFRLQLLNSSRFRIVGLSATLGDFNEARKVTGNPEQTVVLRDKTPKSVDVSFRYFFSDTPSLPLNLLKDLYRNTYQSKVLIFPNSRGRTEEVAVGLRKIAEKVNGHKNYFSHHSSVDRREREYVEHFAKQSRGQNFCISCTSTLELGIDIGAVDKVVQIDATFSIASLVQRLGRSGRREGDKSILLFYATEPWSMLQAAASWLLYRDERIEPVRTSDSAYDVFLHQMLSVVKSSSGIDKQLLINRMTANTAFLGISRESAEEIMDESISKGLLEQLGQEVIIGVDGEVLVNSREFYSVFKAEPNMQVWHKGNKIGEIPFSIMVAPGENMLLAAKIWRIVDVDAKGDKIEVIAATDGRSPLFFGSGGVIHPMIRQKMWDLLINDVVVGEIDEAGRDALVELKQLFTSIQVTDTVKQRPAFATGDSVCFYSFQGTLVNRTLSLLLDSLQVEHTFNDDTTLFKVDISPERLKGVLEKMAFLARNIDEELEVAISKKPQLLEFSKWAAYLPIKFQVEVLKSRYLDLEGTIYFLASTVFICPS